MKKLKKIFLKINKIHNSKTFNIIYDLFLCFCIFLGMKFNIFFIIFIFFFFFKVLKFLKFFFRFNDLPASIDYLTVICGKRGAGKTTTLAVLADKFQKEREKLKNNPKVMAIYNNNELPMEYKFKLIRPFCKKFYFKNLMPDSEIFSNFNISGCNYLEFSDMGLYDFGYGALFLFDEMASGSSGINNRNWQNNFKNSKGNLALDRLLYERHYRSNGVFVVSQSPQSLDSNIENLQPPIWYCRRNRNVLRHFKGTRIMVYDYQLALVADKLKSTGQKTAQTAFGLTVKSCLPFSKKGRGWFKESKYWHMFDSYYTPELPKTPIKSFVDYLRIKSNRALDLIKLSEFDDMKIKIDDYKYKEKIESEYKKFFQFDEKE